MDEDVKRTSLVLPDSAFQPLPEGLVLPSLISGEPFETFDLPQLRQLTGEQRNHVAQAEICVRIICAYPGDDWLAISRHAFYEKLAHETMCGMVTGGLCVEGSIAQHDDYGFRQLYAALEQLIACKVVHTSPVGVLMWPSPELIELVAEADEAA